ncbi:MAG: sugar nucleotide-binding protein [Bdellovibrionota bacterium]
MVQLQDVIERAKHVYFASSTGVYHQNQGETIDETSLTQPTRFSGTVLLQAEQWIQKHSKNHTIIRLSGLYSETRNRLLDLLQNNHPLITHAYPIAFI